MPIPKGIKDEMGLGRIRRSQITACFDGGEVCSDGADAAAWGYEDFNDPHLLEPYICHTCGFCYISSDVSF